jgi:hypothetical protein
MVDPALVKRVLRAVADAHPEAGAFAVRRVEIKKGWGDLINVTIQAVQEPGQGNEEARQVRAAVERVLGSERFRVSLEASN